MDAAQHPHEDTETNNRFRRDSRPTNENPNFVHDYFASSRLHFIGSFRARYESMMIAVGKNLAIAPINLLQPAKTAPTNHTREPIIVHIDMDCFFASVAVTKDPSLAGKCIAVSHGGGEISSCSYEARKFGVHAGMFFKNALNICPQLISVPYDFETYQRISVQIYSRFYAYSNVTVEAVSVDEAYLDITHAVADDPAADASQTAAEALVAKLRTRIFQDTGCTASAGIGPSKLLARLATKSAKPNGQMRIRRCDQMQYLDSLKVNDLPGIGWRTSRRLTDKHVKTVPQLRALSLAQLKTQFGDRQGQLFYDLCRGVDFRPVEPLKPRKSIGAEASWGVRFLNEEGDKVKKFIFDMADLVASRVVAAGASGSRVTFKLYRKKPNSSMEGYKYLGHGPCIILTRSSKLPVKSSGKSLKHALRDICLRLYNDLNIRHEDFRGLGLQVTDLSFSELRLDVPTFGDTRRIESFFSTGADSKVVKPQTTAPPSADVNIETKGLENVDEIEPVVRNEAEKCISNVDRDAKRRVENTKGETYSIEEDRIEVGRAEDKAKTKASEEHGRIPTGWDKEVFEGLPEQLREELLKEYQVGNVSNVDKEVVSLESSDESGVEIRRKRPRNDGQTVHNKANAEKKRKNEVAQITMTQFAAISKLKKKGNDVLNAEEFQSKRLGECIRLMEDCNGPRMNERMGQVSREVRGSDIVAALRKKRRGAHGEEVEWDIPSPPSLSSDSDSDDEMSKVVAKEGLEHKQIYADEDVSEYAPKLKLWMVMNADNVKSGHEELLRGRVLELVEMNKLERVCVEMRTIGAFAMEGYGWRSCYNNLVDDVQNCCQRLYGYRLALGKIGRVCR